MELSYSITKSAYKYRKNDFRAVLKGLLSCCFIMFFLRYLIDTSILLKENSVKTNIKADRSGFFI